MTPAIKLLSQAGIAFAVREYHHDGNSQHYGEHAANALGQDTAQVFKTLLAVLDNNPRRLVVALVPVANQLDLKKLASAMGGKRAEMADPAVAERKTGYVRGGISPVAQRQQWPTTIDSSAKQFETIFVSAGKRGLELEIAPEDLRLTCHASYADIKTD